MLRKECRKYYCCPEPSNDPKLCGSLSYDQKLGVCYSAGNRLATYPRNNPKVNLCVNPWYAELERQQPVNCNRLNKICDLNPYCKPCDPCILDPKYRFFLIKLISNRLNQARIQDLDLVDPWGSVFIDNVLWVVNNLAGLITTYNQVGAKLSTNVSVVDRTGFTSRPSGLVENQTNGFTITNGTTTAPSFLLVATQNGIISGYNPLVDPNNTIQVINRSGFGSVYTGLAIANNNLFVADFLIKE